MQKILRTYLKRLTNLTHRNKSLLLLSLPARQFIDMQELDFLQSKPAFDLIEALIAQKNTIPLFPVHDPRHEKLNKVSKQLRQIQRTADFIEEESGAVDLYVGYPFVRGKFSDGTPVRCPLLFFPVSLETENNRWKLTERDENVVINKHFLLAYSYFNHVPVPDEWLEADFEDFSKESLAFRTQLYEWLKKTPLELNFNQDLLSTNQLIPFDNFNKSRFDETHKTGELKLFPEAVLGIFPQAASYLSPDYQQLIDENRFETTDDFFAGKTTSQPTRPVWEENTFTPFAIDAAQEKAVKWVKEGSSLVVQGPPGTGKSQLIANLLCDYAARGKKVLLVCQKRAALDIVAQRLSQIGMQDFVALVHDFRHDRKGLYQQLGNQIEKLDTYKQQNQNLDAVYLDREFLAQSRKIDKLTTELDAFKKAFFDETECGLSVKELYLTCSDKAPHLSLKKEYKYFHFAVNVSAFLEKLQAWQAYAAKTEAENYAWRNRVSFHAFQRSDREAISELITAIPVFEEQLGKKTEAFLGKKLSFQQAEKLLDERKGWLELAETLRNEAQWQVFLGLFDKKDRYTTTWLTAGEKQLQACFSENGIENTLPDTALADLKMLAEQALQAHKNFISWQFWKLIITKKQPLLAALQQNKLSVNRVGLSVFLEKVQNRIRLEALLSQMREIDEVHRPLEQDYLQRWFENHRQALKTRKMAKKLDFFGHALPLAKNDLLVFQQQVHKLFSLLQEASTTRKSWNQYLTDRQVDKILSGKADTQAWLHLLKEDFDELVEADRLKHAMTHPERDVCDMLLEKQQKTEGQTLTLLFDNSLRLAWIDHIEEKYPVLTSVSTLKMSQTEAELQAACEQKTRLSRNILLMRLRENVFRAVAHNRLKNMTTYRDLKHQVTKKRNIYPVRRLMVGFSEEIFRLVPCWLASPETVSAIFPLSQEAPDNSEAGLPLFDLVVFDEASQCFAENGLPAMFRAAQVVVTGDAKQLTPNDLYQVRFENEEEDTPDTEVESLLDLAARYFPQVQLTGHYRSKTLDLIDFSNLHFYKNTLELLPDRYAMNDPEPGISFIKTEGTFENGSNDPEARQVVEIVSGLLQKMPEKTVGVVTFNFKQQALIQDLLEEFAVTQQMTLPEHLFVKNIENVQGDERDIIIFSVGYAADKSGKVALQFGSLNRQGGENRLNVAVTRAREKVFVVSSILPQQLNTENTAFEGPKLLRKYLEYAMQVSDKHYQPQPLPPVLGAGSRLLKNNLMLMEDNLLPELPFADLTRKQQNVYLSLVLTDDDLYFRSLSAKEAHVYRPVLLAQKNWAVQRFYSRQFWKDAEKLREKLGKI